MATARQIYSMLGNETLWDVARRCHAALRNAEIPHAIAGGVAICLHGYQRNTVDLDLIVRSEDEAAIREALLEAGFEWSDSHREFRSSDGIPVQFLIAGSRTGRGAEAKFADPSAANTITVREDLPVLTLERLIEAKIACGAGDPRRTHKDFADVVELIAIHNLDSSFARHLHKSVRETYWELVKNARAG